MNHLDELLKLIKRIHRDAYLEGSSSGYRVVVRDGEGVIWASRVTDTRTLLREISELINN